MAEATSLRAVWVNALITMCFNNRAITHSYSVSKMSLLELEYAAMGPERWVATVARAHSQKLIFLPPYKIQTFRPPGYLSSLCSKIYLIPGGRYLLTLCRGVGIAIWDLLNTSKSPTEPLATISGPCQYFIASPTSDGLGIRVAVTKYTGDTPLTAW